MRAGSLTVVSVVSVVSAVTALSVLTAAFTALAVLGPSAPRGQASAAAPRRALPLAGRTVVLDPGHNPGNASHPAEINQLVDVGNGRKACNTTGTSTDAGYTEAEFTLDLARRVRLLLAAEGARVILTQDGDRPWGPCVTERAAIGNQAHADAVVALHADGATPEGHGFHVILPAEVVAGAADTRPIVGPSRRLGLNLRDAYTLATGEPFATYLGGGTGLMVRSDLGGLNLSQVPAVFIECGNMRNAADAARLSTPAWREMAAHGVALGITLFLSGTETGIGGDTGSEG
ncbi:N-acetylmuramoyl-L-alanine amidase [Streptacidiphilus pinicola]|uniref:N-acetylmuramoyl-L-alanine amidase n=1 Tax=Streptacidiphilus pinicola TaxID=2219663 RepID=A0A2X0IK39_9ACTN|nr:N-acetylmuramoyl-L-alanine amidase [Streptacidiphilus pinicola]RAG83973.1 N-acetylmuramoyl-L-alanine amidase [Streptacidiphilus pinicola]